MGNIARINQESEENMARKRMDTKKSKESSTNLVIAIISATGTIIAALLGYWGIRYQVDAPTKITQTSQTLPQLDVKAQWVGCGYNGVLLPDIVLPEQNSGSTLTQIPDLDNWPRAPIAEPNYPDQDRRLGRLISIWLTIGNSATDIGGWLKISKAINIDFDLVTSEVESHVNLVSISTGGAAVDRAKFFLRCFYHKRPAFCIKP